MSRYVPTERYQIRMTRKMRARVKRFADELALPSESHFILYAVSELIDRLVALRGESYAEVPGELRRHTTRKAG